jgi:hypothetical protein
MWRRKLSAFWGNSFIITNASALSSGSEGQASGVGVPLLMVSFLMSLQLKISPQRV